MAALGRFTARARRLRRTFEFYRAIHFTERVDPHAHLLLLDYDVDFLNGILAEPSIAEHISLESIEGIRDSLALAAYLLRVVRDPSKKIAPPTWASRYRLISLSRGFLNGRVDDLTRAARVRRYGEKAYHLRRVG